MEFVIPTLRMNFWAGYDLARCYEAIFRTVPLYGLNGCSFSHQETGAPGGGPQVQIVSQDQNVLYHIQNQLVNSAAFMQSQAVPVSQIMIVPQSGVLDGRVSGNMLEPAFGNKESPAVVGWQLAAGVPAAHVRQQKTVVCPACGAVSNGQIFCGQCGMKAGQLSNLAKGFLVVYLILFVGQFFIFLMQNMSYLSYPDVKMLALVNLVQITAQVSGVVLLFYGRKPGFYVLVAERIANGIFYFTIVGLGSGAGMLGAWFGVALFTAVAYACLRKDLPLLK